MGAADAELLEEEEKLLLVQFGTNLYDVAAFAKKHPGGRKVLEKVSGTEITEFLTGQRRILGVKHEHSDAAYEMLERYNVTKRQQSDPLITSKTGMFFRVGDLGHDYWRWIHQPYEGELRLFDSDFLESLTRTSWYVVPLVWLPLVVFFSFISLAQLHAVHGFLGAALTWAFWFALGTLTWTLTEYLLHRFVFHWVPSMDSPNQILLHFLMHGLHHKTPMDGGRLVFPPVPAVPIVGFFYLVYTSIIPSWPIFCAFGSGKLFGYILYDCIHYYLHHGSPVPTTNMHFKKVYHHNHHFKNFDVAFGISTQIWDHVFSTVGMGPL